MHLVYACSSSVVPCEATSQGGHFPSKLKYRRFPSYLLCTLLIFPFHILPSPVNPTGFSLCFFLGFLAIFILFSSNNNNNLTLITCSRKQARQYFQQMRSFWTAETSFFQPRTCRLNFRWEIIRKIHRRNDNFLSRKTCFIFKSYILDIPLNRDVIQSFRLY